MPPTTVAARAARMLAVSALALTTMLTAGLGPVAAAPAAAKLPKPDLIDASIRKGGAPAGAVIPVYVDLTWIDKAANEDGYEIIATLQTTDGSIHTTSKTLKGAIAGTENVGHGMFEGLKAGQRYCFTARAYTLHAANGFDTYGTESNKLCLTMPAATTQAPGPLPSAPATPQNFKGAHDSIYGNTIVLNWSDTSNEDYYYLTAFSALTGEQLGFPLPAPAPRLAANSTTVTIGGDAAAVVGGLTFHLQACIAGDSQKVGGCSAPAIVTVR